MAAEAPEKPQRLARLHGSRQNFFTPGQKSSTYEFFLPKEHRARLRVHDGGESVSVELLDPAYGIAPGQAVVVYDGSRVVGSATIASTPARL